MKNTYRRLSKHNKPKFSNKISKYFSKRDFNCHCGECDKSLKISLGLIGGLELLREISQSRIHILRGYMCPESAEKAKSLKRNFHVIGIAADISIRGKTVHEIFRLAEEIPEFKGIGMHIKENFVHVDTRKENTRVSWVVKDGQRIELTEENRKTYIEETA